MQKIAHHKNLQLFEHIKTADILTHILGLRPLVMLNKTISSSSGRMTRCLLEKCSICLSEAVAHPLRRQRNPDHLIKKSAAGDECKNTMFMYFFLQWKQQDEKLYSKWEMRVLCKCDEYMLI